MADLNYLELNSMILGLIAICILFFISYRKIEFTKYVPGLICLIFVFIAEVFEYGEFKFIFNYLENVVILAGAILLFIAALKEYFELNQKRK